MTGRKFKIADLVELRRVPGIDAPRGPYEIVRLLPEADGVPTYRLRSWHEDHERIADETQLRPIVEAQPQTPGTSGGSYCTPISSRR
jgi:hypothetical protein